MKSEAAPETEIETLRKEWSRLSNLWMACMDSNLDLAIVLSAKLDLIENQIERRLQTERHFEVASRPV
jgi:hypothetical protein